MNLTIKTDLINRNKLALRISTNAFDDELGSIIDAAIDTLKTRGVKVDDENIRPMEHMFITTYVKYHFGDADNPTKLKSIMDEQLAQLMTTSSYTDWSVQNGQK